MGIMLDVAGGVVLGGGVLALMKEGIASLTYSNPRDPDTQTKARVWGFIFLIVGLGAAAWLVLVHTGIASCWGIFPQYSCPTPF
jgi:hypothetical protein